MLPSLPTRTTPYLALLAALATLLIAAFVFSPGSHAAVPLAPAAPAATVTPSHPLQLYLDPQYQPSGTYAFVDNPGNVNLDQGGGTYNNAISSLLLEAGWSVRLYKELNLQGASVCLTASDPDFAGQTFNDGTPLDNQVSSLTLTHAPTCADAPPTAPSNLHVTSTAQGSVTLAWQDNSTNEDGFQIYRYNGITYTQYVTVPANTTTYTDLNVTCNTSYSYKITAYNSTYESAQNGPANGTTQQCNVPAGVTFYLQSGYGGSYCTYAFAGPFNFTQSNQSCPGFNDATASLQVQSGWAVRVYRDPDQGGPSHCYTASDPDFQNDTFSDGSPVWHRISSIYVSNTGACIPADTTPPTVHWTMPVPDNGVYTATGATVPLEVAATDNGGVGVRDVTFTRYNSATGQTITLTVVLTSPYHMTLDVGPLNYGPNRITATAVDRAGNSASQSISIVKPGGTPPPTVTPTATGTPATATPTPGACAIQFTDVPVGSPFYTFIHCLVCEGIVSGYADNTFRPGNDVTRGQLAKFVSNAAGYTDPIPPTQQTFSDVPPSHPFWLFIERAYAHGVISGYSDHTFHPDAGVTRGQAAKFVANAANYADAIPSTRQTFRDVPPTDTFWLFIERVYAHGVISGYSDGTFHPVANVTRGQTSKFISNAFFPNCAPAR
jgi:S-layer family protein/Big-like domain-containing protein